MQRIVLVGYRGMLGQALSAQLATAYPTATITLLDQAELDITNAEAVTEALAPLQPTVIINCAAYTNVEKCEDEEALATRVNGAGVQHLAASAVKHDALLVHISTDFVFPGQASEPYKVDAPRAPLSAYGRSKLAGEKALEESGCRYLLVRTAWLYGEGGANFVETMLRLAAAHGKLAVVADQIGAPTYTADLAAGLIRLVEHGAVGTFHCTNAGATSWHGFAVEIIRLAGLDVPVEELTSTEASERFTLRAARPAYSVLHLRSFEKATGQPMRPWATALAEYMRKRD